MSAATLSVVNFILGSSAYHVLSLGSTGEAKSRVMLPIADSPSRADLGSVWEAESGGQVRSQAVHRHVLIAHYSFIISHLRLAAVSCRKQRQAAKVIAGNRQHMSET